MHAMRIKPFDWGKRGNREHLTGIRGSNMGAVWYSVDVQQTCVLLLMSPAVREPPVSEPPTDYGAVSDTL